MFEGKPLLQRHRTVNSALAAELEHIHAITLKCLTPAQWEEKKKAEQAT
jgi:stress-induced morphogen